MPALNAMHAFKSALLSALWAHSGGVKRLSGTLKTKCEGTGSASPVPNSATVSRTLTGKVGDVRPSFWMAIGKGIEQDIVGTPVTQGIDRLYASTVATHTFYAGKPAPVLAGGDHDRAGLEGLVRRRYTLEAVRAERPLSRATLSLQP